jgi:hypothetical protein
VTNLSKLSDQELIARYQASRPVSSLSDEELVSLHTEQQRTQRLEQLKKENPGEYDPQSKEYQAKYGATTGMTGTQKFLAGAGKSVADLGRGIKQIGAEVGNRVGLVDDETVADIQGDIDESRQLDTELMDTGAGVAGNIAGTVATIALPAGAVARGAQAANLARTATAARTLVNPTTLKAAAAAGATQGALQPVASDGSRVSNAALGAAGGVAGTAVAKMAGRVAQPIKNALTPAVSRAVQTLEAAGVPLDLAQRTGSRFAQRMKNMLQDNPTTAGNLAVQRETQQRAYNRAILNLIGENADAATPDVMGRAQTRLGQVFDDIAERNPIKYDRPLEVQLAAIEKAARDELDDAQFGVVRRQLDNILQKATDGVDQIDGKAYQSIKTSLDRLSLGQDQSKGHYARVIREALDDSLQRSASAEDVAALKVARAQYRRMKQIESAVSTDEGGHISAAKLANSLGTKRNAAQSKYGKGDQSLVSLAKAGKEILPEPTPNSGTPARLLAQLALPGALGIAGGLTSDDPMTGVKLAAATYLIPKLASGAVRPGPITNYLAAGMGNPWVRAALNSPQTNQVAGALTKQAPAAAALALSAPQQ